MFPDFTKIVAQTEILIATIQQLIEIEKANAARIDRLLSMIEKEKENGA